jgi:hypothetical protein
VADYKLDIFETLRAIDNRNKDFYSNLSEDEQKGFAPPVVLRWASSTTNETAEFYLSVVNERANINFWDIAGHPELQYKLLAASGYGRRQGHQWIPNPGAKRKSDKVRSFLAEFWTDANDMELDLILGQYTYDTFVEFVESSGCTPQREKEILEAYGKLVGKPKGKSKGKAKK